MKKLFLLLVLIIALSIFAGCSEDQVSEDVMTDYLHSEFVDADYEQAYDMLSTKSQSQISLDQFIDYNNKINESATILGYEIIDEKERNGLELNDEVYKEATQYTVEFTVLNNETNEEKIYEIEYYVVAEGNKLKVLSATSLRIKYALVLANLGWVYDEGVAYVEGLKEAVKTHLAKLDLNPKDGETYFKLALTYYAQEKYDQALEAIINGIENNADPILLSKLFHLRGNILFLNGDIEKAISSYEKALEYDPDNTSAQNSLAVLQ